MYYRWVDFFVDPILRGPTIGSMLMCAAASLIGVIVFIRRKSLIGEALSHAAYPGLILGAFCFAFFPSLEEEKLLYFLLPGAFGTSLIAVALLDFLQSRFRVKNDSALCFVLSSFLGIGILLASRIQLTHPVWYRQIQTFLYGQAATMTDAYIWIYGILFLSVLGFIIVFYYPLRLVYFDKGFADSIGFSVQKFERVFLFFLVLAVVVAIKSVGVVLLSGMLIAPALSARRLTHRLSAMFCLSAFFGASSGFLGNYFSVKLSQWIQNRLVFPTGPMIVLFSSSVCLGILLFVRPALKKIPFSYHKKNLLKALIDLGEEGTFSQIHSYANKNPLRTQWLLWTMKKSGWIEKKQRVYRLTSQGKETLQTAFKVEKT